MTEELIISQAFDTAWIVYRTVHREISVDDSRRSDLARFLRMRVQSGEADVEALALEGIAYLRRLEPLQASTHGFWGN
jgi:hypothetical protein